MHQVLRSQTVGEVEVVYREVSPADGSVILMLQGFPLDLPLRVLVRERADGTAAISFHPVAATLRRAGAPEDAAARLEPAQRLLLAAVVP